MDFNRILKNSIIEGDIDEVTRIIKEGLKMGLNPLEMLEKGLMPGIRIVGEKYGSGELFLPELIMASESMVLGSELLRGEIEKEGKRIEFIGTFMIATVKDDIHTIGKNLVSTMLRVEGFKVIDLGRDVPTETIVEKVRELKPDILGLSALLTSTMIRQREVIEKLKDANLRDKVKVIIGGAPTNEKWAEEIGADAWAPDALAAAKLSSELISVRVRGQK